MNPLPSILVGGENFGVAESGFSQLLAAGIRVVVARSFDQQFYRDCFTHLLLPAMVSQQAVDSVSDWIVSNESVASTVDLQANTIECPGIEAIPFKVDSRLRNKLLLGLSDLDEMLLHRQAATEFRSQYRNRLPWLYEIDESV